MRLTRWIEGLPTPAKLLLFLSAALLPFGAILAWTASSALVAADNANRQNARLDASMLGDSIQELVARNALALRISANAALDGTPGDRCAIAQHSLAIAPALSREFELEDASGRPLCATPGHVAAPENPMVGPGDIKLWIAGDGTSLMIRTGVVRGSATTRIPLGQLVELAKADRHLISATLGDGENTLPLIVSQTAIDESHRTQIDTMRLADGRLSLVTVSKIDPVELADRLSILLPVVMWALAGILSWFLMHRLLIGPLRRLQQRVGDFTPGDDIDQLVEDKYGAASEIRDLAESFAAAVARIDEGEKRTGEALEGQRRLVREVHHRVKNNLQVVASLLSIHGRSAIGNEARGAYAGIGRRVDALSVVHRNHFAELEENQGIQLRPLLTELASGLRSSAPKEAVGFAIDLDLEPASTTQDTAVAVAFFVTELVEFAMVASPSVPAEISLRRSSELTARLTVTSKVLYDEEEPSGERRQFERIVEAIARQLRSPLERTMGRYSVEIAVFPDR
jgi:two-component sensor histidine kinase